MSKPTGGFARRAAGTIRGCRIFLTLAENRIEDKLTIPSTAPMIFMSESLTIYLQDHLVGSNFAVELLKGWRSSHENEPPGILAVELGREIEADQAELRQIIERIGGASTTMKESVGWLAEKVARFKLRHEEKSALGVFEGLEILALGILGKLSLWEALAELAPSDPRLCAHDFNRLAARAREQHARVEAHRRGMIKELFSAPAGPGESSVANGANHGETTG